MVVIIRLFCVCVFAPASCFDMRWLSCDRWPTFWASFAMWQVRPSETFKPCWPFIRHGLECPFWVLNPLLASISRTWCDSLQNCIYLLLKVDMIEAFVWFITNMSQKPPSVFIIHLLTPWAFPFFFLHSLSVYWTLSLNWTILPYAKLVEQGCQSCWFKSYTCGCTPVGSLQENWFFVAILL